MASKRTRFAATVIGLAALAVVSISYCYQLSATPFSASCRTGTPPPALTSPELIDQAVLRFTPPALTVWARALGGVTTPLKVLGIRGWIATGLTGSASGVVERRYRSTDSMQTVDLRLDQFQISGRRSLASAGKLLRIEVFGGRLSAETVAPPIGAHWKVSGQLVWDCDGFVELHP